MISNFFASFLQFFADHMNFIIGVVINVALIWAACKVTDVFQEKIENRLHAKMPDSPLVNLMPVLTKIFKILIIFILLAGFLQSFGYNVASLIAGFGITGLAVGFAAKEAISNVFGSFGLLADRVYKIGEYISFGNYEGTVENINLRSTTIRNLDGFLVNVPNNLLANEEIVNLSQTKRRQIDISADIEYGTSNEKIDRACEILKEIADEDKLIWSGALAFIDSMAPSSIVVRLICYTKAVSRLDYAAEKSAILRKIIRRYREEEISFAFPSTSVYMKNED